MLILLTNDDGYSAPGLASLRRVASRFADVVVVAPSEEQSYMGHRVTTGRELRATEYEPGCFHVDGTPADCVRVAIRALGLQPDWVFSGINRGGNLGVDVYTSGTVAAAREAAIWGLPAVALSQYVVAQHPLEWSHSETMAYRALSRIQQAGCPGAGYWNVNFPHPNPFHPLDSIPLRECEVDPSPQDVHFLPSEGAWRFSGRYGKRPARVGYDVESCFAEAITLSLLRL